MTCDIATLPVVSGLYTAGDTLPDLEIHDDARPDLTGYTITLHLQQPDGTILVKTAVPVDLAQASFKIVWDPGDLVEGLGQLAEVQFESPGGQISTSAKFLIDVARELA